MNLVAPTALVVGIALLLINLFSSKEKHLNDGGNLVYKFPRSMALTVFLCAVAFATMPIWVLLLDPKTAPRQLELFAIAAPCAGIALLCFLWLKYYRVVLSDTAIQSGAFWIKKMPYDRILRASYRRKILNVYGLSGATLKVDRAIVDFSSFIAELTKRLPPGVKIEIHSHPLITWW